MLYAKIFPEIYKKLISRKNLTKNFELPKEYQKKR